MKMKFIHRKKYEIISFLKGYSILAIIIYHFFQTLNLKSPFNILILGGGTGVHVFILLSGLGLFLSQKKNTMTYFKFIRKRAIKVYLPYILIVSITAFITIFIPIYNKSLYAYFGHLFLYKMFDESIYQSYGAQFWFISMIIQFYLCFNLIFKIKQKFSNIIFFALCLSISIIWAIFLVTINLYSVKIWRSFFLQYLWEFSLGIIIADNIENIEKKVTNLQKLRPLLFSLFFFVIGIIGIAFYGFLAIKGKWVGRIFNDIPALIGFSFLGIFLYLLKLKTINSFLIFTGHISFTLFLLHLLIYKLIIFYFTPSLLLILLAISLCYITSYFYQKALDKIFLIKLF